jgi:hypothetical protein
VALFVFFRPGPNPAVANTQVVTLAQLFQPSSRVDVPSTTQKVPQRPKVTKLVQPAKDPPVLPPVNIPPASTGDPKPGGIPVQDPTVTPLNNSNLGVGVDPTPPPPLPPPPPPTLPSKGIVEPTDIPEDPVADVDVEPKRTNECQPKIPAGASGTVLVKVLILRTGKVARPIVENETPYKEAIITAALQCTFKPAIKRGRAVAVERELTFQLSTNK